MNFISKIVHLDSRTVQSLKLKYDSELSDSHDAFARLSLFPDEFTVHYSLADKKYQSRFEKLKRDEKQNDSEIADVNIYILDKLTGQPKQCTDNHDKVNIKLSHSLLQLIDDRSGWFNNLAFKVKHELYVQQTNSSSCNQRGHATLIRNEAFADKDDQYRMVTDSIPHNVSCSIAN